MNENVFVLNTSAGRVINAKNEGKGIVVLVYVLIAVHMT